ncbi:MAG: hypothetical protein LBE35_03640 [Clostridiales bacterium]|jgi:hypothetical protein|nr:hypothetical protein [Clostridiales bacterium]
MEANTMTDFQFRAVIRMVLDQFENATTLNDYEKVLENLEGLTEGETSKKLKKPRNQEGE